MALNTHKGVSPDYLHGTDLLKVGNGQCGAWADFMNQVLRGQGLTSINGYPKYLVSVKIKTPYSCFAINNWATSGTSPRTVINSLNGTWGAGVDGLSAATPNPTNSEAADAKGAPGQGNSPNPSPTFGNHWIFYCEGNYYDPSYGIGPKSNQKDYENEAFCGRIDVGDKLWDLPATDTINTYTPYIVP